VTVSFDMIVRLSVCLHGRIRFPLDGYLWSSMVGTFTKICRPNSVMANIWQRQHLYLWMAYHCKILTAERKCSQSRLRMYQFIVCYMFRLLWN